MEKKIKKIRKGAKKRATKIQKIGVNGPKNLTFFKKQIGKILRKKNGKIKKAKNGKN